MILRRLSLAFLISSLSLGSVKAISEPQAVASAIVAGAVGGIMTYQANKGSSDLTRSFATLLVGGTVGILGYCFASRCTPIGRYKRAVDEIALVAGDELFSRNFSDYQQLKTYLQLRYPTDWYLVSGKLRLFKLFDKLCWADETLKYARNEKSATPQLIELCKLAEQPVVPLFKKYAKLLALLDSDQSEYHQQRRHYDAFLRRRELLDAEAREEMHYWNSFTQRERLYREKINALQFKMDNQ